MSQQIQNILIAPFKTGLDTDTEPWLAPPDSFRDAENVHIKHGYLEKRSGYRLFGTLSNGTRVMGIARYIESDGFKELICFDTLNAYRYDTTTETFVLLDAAGDIFNSLQYDYVHAVNWQSSNLINRLYFTNGKAWNGLTDPNSLNGIRYYSADSSTNTVSFNPSTGGGNTLYGCKMLFTLGGRIIALSTFENDGLATNEFPQRARWCAKQSPSNWNDLTAGGGDYADAATGDQIISAQALQNQLIVFFSNSVWALQPTSDPNKAFRWVRLNNYRACDGKMASVSYDRVAIAIGVRGITATDGSQTQRIDQRIVDFTNNDINRAEFKKVFCYRSYETQRWWTLYPSGESEENNKVLIYDDESKAYTKYDLSLNCLGYGNTDIDYRLSDFSIANNLDYSLNEMGQDTLQDWYFDQTADLFLGGDISGNIYQLDFGAEDIEDTIDATFTTAAWNPYIAEGCDAQMVYVDFYVDTDKATTGKVEFYVNDQDTPYTTQEITFLPNLYFVANVTGVTNTNPCVVTAPEHGLQTGETVYIYGANGMKELNSSGYTITVISDDIFSLNNTDATTWGVYTGGANVYLKEFYQTRTWIRTFAGATGYTHWIKVNLLGGERPFRFHSIKAGFRKRGKRTIN
jgi:hypothetical protein